MAIVKISMEMMEKAFHEHYEGLHRYAYTLTKENEVSKDIVQQIFMTLWEKKESTAITGSLQAYLFRSVHNRCINHNSRTKKFDLLDEAMENTARTSTRDHYSIETNEVQEQLKAALNKLPPQCKAVFLQQREQNMTYAQVAENMGLSIKTVEAHMTKALKILREELSTYLYYLLVIAFMGR